MKVYTEDQKFDNYKRLVRDIREIRNGRDLKQTDVAQFLEIRNYYSDFQKLNLENKDVKFRRKAYETEQMCRYLQMYLQEHSVLEMSVYVQVLERVRYLFESVLTPEEIADVLESMNI